MRKLYAIMFLVMSLAVFSAKAEDVSFTFKVNHPDKVTLKCNDGRQLTLTGEETQLVVPMPESGYLSVFVTVADGYWITKFESAEGTPVYNYGTSGNLYPETGKTYILELVNLEEERTGNFTIDVDDASKVSVRVTETNTELTLGNGVNNLKYAPALEKKLYISNSNSNPNGLYKVILNDEEVPKESSGYNVTLSENCHIVIKADYPDEPRDVTFTYANADSEGFWTGAEVNYMPVENFDGKKLTVKIGDMVTIKGNNSKYKVNSLTVGGSAVSSFYGEYSFQVMENTAVVLDARPYATVKFTLNIDHPEFVDVFNAQWGYGEAITGLKAGENPLEFSETNTYISFKAKGGCYITSITDGDGKSYSSYVTVTEGMVINVVSGEIKMDQDVIVWLDSDPAVSAPTYFNSVLDMGSERKTFTLNEGYNVINVSEQYNQVNFSWYGSTVSQLYLNGERQDGETSYYVTLKNGDVVKIFLAAEPETVGVTISAEGNMAALADVEVTRDRMTAVTSWQGVTESVFAGTEYTIKATEASVKLNGTDVEKGEDGIYTVVIPEGASTAEITISGLDGIGTVAVDDDSSTDIVYNLQGIRVGVRGDLPSLPAGIYIVGGQKTIVR